MTPHSLESDILDHRFEAMATPVSMRVLDPHATADAVIRQAEAVVRAVDRSCTRFDNDSELSRVNARPAEWHNVSPIFAAAVTAAELAATETDGRVDPRVIDDLEQLGYSVTFELVDSEDAPPRGAKIARRSRPTFRVDHEVGRLRLDGTRIDLGGIAKGLAVDCAAAVLSRAGTGALVEAGGDLAVVGLGPDSGGWNIDVEDPWGRGLDRDTIAVLSVADAGVATSSIRHRSWRHAGKAVHHLIDPSTGQPADTGLTAVTVVAGTTVAAERWTKALFLAGAGGIRAEADARGIAALWVDDAGAMSWSRELESYLLWRSPDVAIY